MFRIHKHQTVDSLFPLRLAGLSHVNNTMVLLYENNTPAVAQNRSAVTVATYFSGFGWFSTPGNNEVPDRIIAPDTQFVVRNRSGMELKVFLMGVVPEYRCSFLIRPNDDLTIGSGYPVPVKLGASGMDGSNRQLLFVDNTTSEENKSATVVATYFTGFGWFSPDVPDANVHEMGASEGFILRLPAGETASKITMKRPY
jgi:hypothetical protein